MSLIQLGLSKGLRGIENLFQKTSLTVKKKKLLQAKEEVITLYCIGGKYGGGVWITKHGRVKLHSFQKFPTVVVCG